MGGSPGNQVSSTGAPLRMPQASGARSRNAPGLPGADGAQMTGVRLFSRKAVEEEEKTK